MAFFISIYRDHHVQPIFQLFKEDGEFSLQFEFA